MDKYVGKKIDGRYEIQEIIGIGGMAVVYKAYDSIDDRVVAVKILKDEFLSNDEFIRRFKNESKAISILSHPNIVKVYDVSFGDRIQYIVMEYIDGITLKEYISQQGVLGWKEAVYFIAQILRALQHAHEKGIVHRDIKPQNIMLLPDGNIKVTDFGIARFSKSETRTMTDKAIGSVHYIAPEQARGDLTDHRADLYSVGVILYELITGQLPFEADNAVSVAIMQLQAQAVQPRDINPTIPEGLEEITIKAMQKDPAQRYQSAAEMFRDIDEFRKNPAIHFNFKFFIDDNPTRYIDAIDDVRPDSYEEPPYDYGYDQEEEEEEEKSPVMPILAGIAAALVVFAVVFGVFSIIRGQLTETERPDIELPDYTGQIYNDVLAADGSKFTFEVEKYQNSADYAEGVIISQTPRGGGKSVKQGALVQFTVSAGQEKIQVPELSGLEVNEAIGKLNTAKLNYRVIEVYDKDAKENHVVSSSPLQGVKVEKASTVVLYVCRGEERELVIVPKCVGKSQNQAKQALESAGLKMGSPTEADSSEPKGTVISQNPFAGKKVEEGTTVSLVISSGNAPDVPEKTVDISVDLPKVNLDIAVKVYVGGVKNDQYSQTINPAQTDGTFHIIFTGSSGQKSVSVTLNSRTYRRYTINFDTGSYTVDQREEFVQPSSEAVTSPPAESSRPASSRTPSSSGAPPDTSSDETTQQQGGR